MPKELCRAVERFDVDDIDDARGVRRLAKDEDIERVGTKNRRPSDSYRVGFTNGAFVYTVNLLGRRGLYLKSRPWKSQPRTTSGLPAANAPPASRPVRDQDASLTISSPAG